MSEKEFKSSSELYNYVHDYIENRLTDNVGFLVSYGAKYCLSSDEYLFLGLKGGDFMLIYAEKGSMNFLKKGSGKSLSPRIIEEVMKAACLYDYYYEMIQRECAPRERCDPAAAPAARECAPREPEFELELVNIPGGSFMMGSPEWEGNEYEKPQHEVTIKPFLMGKYPVTQAQYEQVMGSNLSTFKGDDRPVTNVSWYDAVEFCKRLSKQTGKEYRLPSEAEWEYACRAGTTTKYYFGETIKSDLANYDGNVGQTTAIGKYQPNAFGLYDIHGNVWEWCQDDWHDNYEGAPTDGSAWLSSAGVQKVRRGGSWINNSAYCRSAIRYGNTRDSRSDIFGFRVVCENREPKFPVVTVPGIELELVNIPGGNFMMGSPEGEGYEDETPRHQVTVQPFCMGKYPITQEQYEKVMGKNPSHFKGDGRPVDSVSWNDAVEFCRKLSEQTGRRYRLPTEAEWEYACRAGTESKYSFGDIASPSDMNFDGNVGETTSVGSFPPNDFGLHDMHGLVWEWCQDDWHDSYEGAPEDGSAWISEKKIT